MRDAKAAWFTSALLAAASLASPLPARERAASVADQRHALHIPAGPLAAALATLAGQTGTSFVIDGALPARRVTALDGRMTAERAYARLLAGTGLVVRRLGPATFRLVADTADPSPAAPSPDVIVTARKLGEPLSQVPGPVAIHRPRGGADAAGGTADVAATVEGLVVTDAGPGESRLFLRGVADSPFVGFGQSPVSVYLDEARVTYDAPDPDLRLVDIDRVEVLKGPQGPLYGTGALGGVLRVVTSGPDLAAIAGHVRAGVTALPGHGAGAGGEATVNLPLVAGVAGVRLVGYADTVPGWISDAGGREDVNRTTTTGLRLSARVAPVAGWTLDLVGAGQDIHARDSQYVDGAADDLTRADRPAEPRTNDIRVASAALHGTLGTRTLTVVASYAAQHTARTDDASAAAALLGLSTPLRYTEQRRYHVFDGEARLASDDALTPWTVGLSFLSSRSRAHGTGLPAAAPSQPLLDAGREVGELAVFAQGSHAIAGPLRLELGLRLFRSTAEQDRRGTDVAQARSRSFIGISPSATLSWTPAPAWLGYLRVASALRPGGLDPSNSRTGRYDADQLLAFEGGVRHAAADGHLFAELGLFQSIWSDVQSDYLLADGLIATRNAGRASITGADATLDWRPGGGWAVVAGLSAQRARLVRSMAGIDLARDPRLPAVPDLSGHAELRRTLGWGDWRVTPAVSARYVGRSRLSLDPGLDRRMGDYAQADASLEGRRGPTAIRLSATNLGDARGDTLAFGNPFSVRLERQYTPLRPRALTLSVARDF